MTAEEYRKQLKEQIKQEAKDDLRKRKEFLQAVDQAKQSQTLRQAVEGITHQDDTDEWIGKLNQQTAVNEAKSEMALDAAMQQELDRKAALERAAFELEAKKQAAQALMNQMKREMGLLPEEEKTEDRAQRTDENSQQTTDDRRQSTENSQEAENVTLSSAASSKGDTPILPKTLGDF